MPSSLTGSLNRVKQDIYHMVTFFAAKIHLALLIDLSKEKNKQNVGHVVKLVFIQTECLEINLQPKTLSAFASVCSGE